jgi:predicted ThiF/HesA family dinucleotide-utilizing enzyme
MKLPKDVVLNATIEDGQSVKIIGLGGVGGIAARYAMLMLASLNKNVRVVLIDGDEFEHKNATRMFFGGYGNKAEVFRNDIIERFKDSTLSVVAVPEYITPQNEKNLLRDGDIVICCVDNHSTRKLINDRCGKLKNVTLISGGNDGVGADSTGAISRGTAGNVQVFARRKGQNVSPPLDQFHQEIAKPADKRPDQKSCTDLIISVPQILPANLTVASHIVNALWLTLCGQLHYSEHCFDIADGIANPLPFPPPKIGAFSADPAERDRANRGAMAEVKSKAKAKSAMPKELRGKAKAKNGKAKPLAKLKASKAAKTVKLNGARRTHARAVKRRKAVAV